MVLVAIQVRLLAVAEQQTKVMVGEPVAHLHLPVLVVAAQAPLVVQTL